MSERLHKALAQHGLGSRREVERWIAEGRLQLNGKDAQVGDRYQLGDRVLLDGKDVSKRLQRTAAPQVMAYHKPQGQALDRERGGDNNQDTDVPDGETVQDRLPVQRGVRWIPINPMHPGDSGLLLLTNDGALSYALTRHKKQIPAVYMVRVYVRGGVTAAPVLPTTLRLDEETIEFTQVELSTNASTNAGSGEVESETDNVWYKVALARADKRAAVRALFVSHGLTISRMMQVSFAAIELTKDLPRSRHQLLKPAQVELLYQAAELKRPLNDVEPMRGDFKPRPDKRARLKRAGQDKPVRRQASSSEDAQLPSVRRAVSKRASDSSRIKSVASVPQRSGTARRNAGGSNRPSRPSKPSR